MPGTSNRTENLKKNVIAGFIAQLMTLLLSFVGRRLFVNYLSIEYLGINGLYTNILSVLSLAELGLGSVVAYTLYKPVADNNEALICTLVHYFKKIYLIIGGVVACVGLVLIPFLKYIVTSDLPESKLIIYYVLFLISTVSTYLVAHKVALLAAYQENRVQRYVALATAFAQQLVHIGILLICPNYILYVSATILCTLASNYALGRITNRRYRYLLEKSNPAVPFDKQGITKNIKSTALYKLSTVLINSTDNILISLLVSTAAVGLYSNYYILFAALQSFLWIVTSSLMNGIGNLYTEKNAARMLNVFNMLVLAYHFISCYCAISLYFVFNDFISIWLGNDYLMSTSVVMAISINFYLTNLLTPIWSFREATGQFYKAKYIMLACAIVNIMLSIVLGIRFGVFGILIATAISKLLTMVWYEPRILFANVFQSSSRRYWLHQLKYVGCTGLCFILCMRLSAMINSSVSGILVKCIGFFVICLCVFLLCNARSDEVAQIVHEIRIRRTKNT